MLAAIMYSVCVLSTGRIVSVIFVQFVSHTHDLSKNKHPGGFSA